MRRITMILLLAFSAAVCGAAGKPGTMVPSAALYGYDRTQPLFEKLTRMEENPIRVQYNLEYTSTNGQRVYGYYFVPVKGKGPFPCIIFMHGAGGSKNDLAIAYDYFAMRGYAVLALDAAFHGERAVPNIDVFRSDWYQYRNLIMQTVVDMRRAIDWMETRPEIDAKRVGYFGASQGSFIGAVFAGVEPRVAATMLLIGGADFHLFFQYSQVPNIALMRNLGTKEQIAQVAEELAVVDPQYYIGAISPRPVLLMNGRSDFIVSPQAGAKLQELAGEPKETYWYNGGHLPPFDRALVTSAKFFKKYLQGAFVPPQLIPTAVGKPELDVSIVRDFSNPKERFVTLTARTKKPIPPNAVISLNFPIISPADYPIFDDGTHGDKKAGDGVWTMRFVFGPYVPELDLVGGMKSYEVEVRVISADGKVVVSKNAGSLLVEEKK